MRRQPDAVFIVDLRKEQLAVREAQRLGLPVIALVDTNCDPDEATYVVPGNDDASRSCSLVVRAVADGIAAAKTRVTEEELTQAPQEPAPAEEVSAEEEPVAAPAAPGAATEAAEGARSRPASSRSSATGRARG
jgi:small subunit ribosomal protein S2